MRAAWSAVSEKKSNAQKSNSDRPLLSSRTLALRTADFNPLNAISLYTSAANRWASEASNVRLFARHLPPGTKARRSRVLSYAIPCRLHRTRAHVRLYAARRLCVRVEAPESERPRECIRSDERRWRKNWNYKNLAQPTENTRIIAQNRNAKSADVLSRQSIRHWTRVRLLIQPSCFSAPISCFMHRCAFCFIEELRV